MTRRMGLTKREHEMANLLCSGYRIVDCSPLMGVSPKRATAIFEQICQRLGAFGRYEVLNRLAHMGYPKVDLPENTSSASVEL